MLYVLGPGETSFDLRDEDEEDDEDEDDQCRARGRDQKLDRLRDVARRGSLAGRVVFVVLVHAA